VIVTELHWVHQDIRMADAVDDYMSISFVVEDKEVSRKKKQGTIINNTSNKQQRKKQRRFSQQEHMDTTLKEGLSKPIEASNKGFKLLEKFGFKKEEGGLGKLGKGIQEPIKVRSQIGQPTNLGIGKERSLLQVQTRVKEELVKHSALLETNFRHSLKHVQECKLLSRDVAQAEKVIEQLDQREDVARHELWSLQVEDEKQDNDDDVDSLDVAVEEAESEGCAPDDYPSLLHKLELRLVVSPVS
jgi:hypothetical protein